MQIAKFRVYHDTMLLCTYAATKPMLGTTLPRALPVQP